MDHRLLPLFPLRRMAGATAGGSPSFPFSLGILLPPSFVAPTRLASSSTNERPLGLEEGVSMRERKGTFLSLAREEGLLLDGELKGACSISPFLDLPNFGWGNGTKIHFLCKDRMMPACKSMADQQRSRDTLEIGFCHMHRRL